MKEKHITIKQVDGLETTLLVNDTVGRFCVTIFNQGPNAIYVSNQSTIVADPEAANVIINPGGQLEDTSSEDDWYAICATGETAVVKVVEVY